MQVSRLPVSGDVLQHFVRFVYLEDLEAGASGDAIASLYDLCRERMCDGLQDYVLGQKAVIRMKTLPYWYVQSGFVYVYCAFLLYEDFVFSAGMQLHWTLVTQHSTQAA
jgi:hypothetical protein